MKKDGKNFSWYSPKLEVRDTKKYGKGVFAKEDIKEGTVVYVLGGKKMSTNDFAEMVNSDKENIDDPLQVGKRTYIDLDEISRTFNHSCDPTTGVRGRSELFALKDIKKDDQITYDYSSVIAPTEWKMKCQCGSQKCRKILGDIRSISKSQLIYYKSKGALQRYMKNIVKELESGTYTIPKYELLLLQKLKKTDNL